MLPQDILSLVFYPKTRLLCAAIAYEGGAGSRPSVAASAYVLSDAALMKVVTTNACYALASPLIENETALIPGNCLQARILLQDLMST
jgi:hypothetical protein